MMRENGFTLLELLVAMSIFAVMSIMAYSGLSSMIDTRQYVEQEADKLAELQLALTFLGRDVQQAMPRTVKDQFGDTLAAMLWSDTLDPQLELTRNGWNNPTGRPRSTMQRVRYQLREGSLMRYSWSVLDRAPGSEPFFRVVIGNVEHFTVSFLDNMGQWHQSWPVNPMGGDITAELMKQLPEAIRISLDLKEWGRIERVFLVAR